MDDYWTFKIYGCIVREEEMTYALRATGGGLMSTVCVFRTDGGVKTRYSEWDRRRPCREEDALAATEAARRFVVAHYVLTR